MTEQMFYINSPIDSEDLVEVIRLDLIKFNVNLYGKCHEYIPFLSLDCLGFSFQFIKTEYFTRGNCLRNEHFFIQNWDL